MNCTARLQAAGHSASNQSLQCSSSSPVASELRLLRPQPQPNIYWMYDPEQNFEWWWVRIIWFQALQHNIKYKSDLWWDGRRGEPVEEIFPLSFYWRVYFVMPTIKGEESRAGNQIMRSLKFHNLKEQRKTLVDTHWCPLIYPCWYPLIPIDTPVWYPSEILYVYTWVVESGKAYVKTQGFFIFIF